MFTERLKQTHYQTHHSGQQDRNKCPGTVSKVSLQWIVLYTLYQHSLMHVMISWFTGINTGVDSPKRTILEQISLNSTLPCNLKRYGKTARTKFREMQCQGRSHVCPFALNCSQAGPIISCQQRSVLKFQSMWCSLPARTQADEGRQALFGHRASILIWQPTKGGDICIGDSRGAW